MRADSQQIQYCCGVLEIGAFSSHDSYKESLEFIKDSQKNNYAFFISTFTRYQREAYEEMKENFRLIYQSPVRRNPNSGNMIFICIYTSK